MVASEILGVPATPLLTVEEAAGVLRVGRSLAHQLAREHGASGALSGMPAMRVDCRLPVPRLALLELVLAGRAVRVCDAPIAAGIVGGE